MIKRNRGKDPSKKENYMYSLTFQQLGYMFIFTASKKKCRKVSGDKIMERKKCKVFTLKFFEKSILKKGLVFQVFKD